MSSDKPVTGPRLQLLPAVLAAIGVAAAVSACGDGTAGFRPLYGSATLGGADVEKRLAALDVAPIPGRVGQRIRNELIFQATGGGARADAEYRVDIAINEYVSSTLVQSDGNATGQVYNIDAAYQLIRISDQAVVAKGKSYARAGFQRLNSVFSNVRAREEAENRAAKTVGEELRTRLLAHLSQQT